GFAVGRRGAAREAHGRVRRADRGGGEGGAALPGDGGAGGGRRGGVGGEPGLAGRGGERVRHAGRAVRRVSGRRGAHPQDPGPVQLRERVAGAAGGGGVHHAAVRLRGAGPGAAARRGRHLRRPDRRGVTGGN